MQRAGLAFIYNVQLSSNFQRRKLKCRNVQGKAWSSLDLNVSVIMAHLLDLRETMFFTIYLPALPWLDTSTLCQPSSMLLFFFFYWRGGEGVFLKLMSLSLRSLADVWLVSHELHQPGSQFFWQLLLFVSQGFVAFVFFFPSSRICTSQNLSQLLADCMCTFLGHSVGDLIWLWQPGASVRWMVMMTMERQPVGPRPYAHSPRVQAPSILGDHKNTQVVWDCAHTLAMLYRSCIKELEA